MTGGPRVLSRIAAWQLERVLDGHGGDGDITAPTGVDPGIGDRRTVAWSVLPSARGNGSGALASRW